LLITNSNKMKELKASFFLILKRSLSNSFSLISIIVKIMHKSDVFSSKNIAQTNQNYLIDFSEAQLQNLIFQSGKLKDLFQEKTKKKEFFYGIEIIPQSKKTIKLDYNVFGSLLPLFTSIVWLGYEYIDMDFINDIEAIKIAQYLNQSTNVLPHFSAHHLNDKRLVDVLNLNLKNIFIVRGDQVEDQQKYQYAADLVREVRKIRGGQCFNE